MRIKQLGLPAVIVLLLIIFTVTAPNFLSMSNILSIVSGMVIVTIVAIGLTYSLSVDGFDLSVGSTVTLSNTLIISLFVWHQLSYGLSVIVTLLCIIGVALLNLVLILYFRVPDLYATLATMFIVEGVALTYSEGGSISVGMSRQDGSATTGQIPAAFSGLATPASLIVILLIIGVIAYFLLHRTNPGRIMYMIGANKQAAKFSGIKVHRHIAAAYIISTLLAGVSGILLAAQVSSAQINSGAGYLMTAVAAAFIGATASASHKPNVIGTILGALLIAVLENGLVMLSVPYYALNIVKGCVLAIALILNYQPFTKGGRHHV